MLNKILYNIFQEVIVDFNLRNDRRFNYEKIFFNVLHLRLNFYNFLEKKLSLLSLRDVN